MSIEIYQEIAHAVSSEFIEQKSKFIGFAFPVHQPDDIEEMLNELRAKHRNANHLCFAYRLGEEYEHYRFSDDGEPGGTAGRPIFGQIEAYDLTNVLVVVVRYFGGIKLGTGGLVSNYQKSAKLTLEAATIVEKEILQLMDIVYDYHVTNDVQRIFYELDITVINTNYLEQCHCQIAMGKNKVDLFHERIININGLRII